jgi:hypothetical protein
MFFVKLFFTPVFYFIEVIVKLVPNAVSINGGIGQSFYEYMGMGLYFFGSTPFTLVISCVLAWCQIQLSWIIIEWCYHKIPGIT